MLQSVLLLMLFVGLISMLLTDDGKGRYVRFLLIVVMLLSLVAKIGDAEWDFPETEAVQTSLSSVTPEKEALHALISERICRITGSQPILIESDLQGAGETWQLTEIYVVIERGDCEEVRNDLRQTFSFDGFVVRQKEGR